MSVFKPIHFRKPANLNILIVLIIGLSFFSGCGTEEVEVEVVQRTELRVPEEGNFSTSYSDSNYRIRTHWNYNVVLQIHSNLVSAIAAEEEFIKDAIRTVLPESCRRDSGVFSDEITEEFVEALPAEWQIRTRDAQISYSCDENYITHDVSNNSPSDAGYVDN